MAHDRPSLAARFAALRGGAAASGRRPRRNAITAVDVTDGWLHVAQAALRGAEPRIIRLASVRLEAAEKNGTEPPAATGEAIARAWKSLRLDAGPVVFGVPRSQVILRVLTLPPTRRDSEVAAMVYFQISRDLPFRLEDAVLDFQVLPPAAAPANPPASAPTTGSGEAPGTRPESTGGTRVLAAVVRRDTVEQYSALAKAAGLRLGLLGLRPLAVAHAAALGLGPGEAADGAVAVVSLEADGVSFEVLAGGALVFSRLGSLPPRPATATATATTPEDTAGAPVTSADVSGPALEAAALETLRSVHGYEGTPDHQRLTAIVVAGPPAFAAALAERLATRHGLPARPLTVARALLPSDAAAACPEAALPAIGLALTSLDASGAPFDFLDPKRPPAPRDDRRVRRLAAVAGVLAVLLTIGGIRTHLVRKREQVRKELQEQVTLASKNLSGFRAVRTQARTLTDWSAQSRTWLDHLALLSALLPPSQDLYLTALSTSSRNGLSLSARVRSGETIDRLGAALRAAGYSVKPPGITPVNDRFGYRFQASLEIEVPATITNQLDQLVVETRRPRGESAAAPPSPTSAPPPAAPPSAEANANSSPPPQADAAAGSNPGGSEERPYRRGRRRPEGGARE